MALGRTHFQNTLPGCRRLQNGRVAINGAQAKPSRSVKEGDEVAVRKSPVTYTFKVKQAIENAWEPNFCRKFWKTSQRPNNMKCSK